MQIEFVLLVDTQQQFLQAYIQKLAKTWIYLAPYVCTELIFDSPQQNIFEKNLMEICSPYLYDSFGTFCAQICQLFEAQWVFEICLVIEKSLLSKENAVDFGNLPNV